MVEHIAKLLLIPAFGWLIIDTTTGTLALLSHPKTVCEA